MIRITSSIIAIIMLCGCERTQPLDLSLVDFNKDSKEYRLVSLSPSKIIEQNGHYEVIYKTPSNKTPSVINNANVSVVIESNNVSLIIKDDGEKVTRYLFEEGGSSKYINYSGLPLDALHQTEIVDYNGKVSFISTSANRDKTIELITSLLKKLGEPTEVINNEVDDGVIKEENINKLMVLFPDKTKKIKDDSGSDVIFYPGIVVWDKNDKIYKLSLKPAGKDIDNILEIISKKAISDKVIFGHHVPDKDPLFSKYLK
ncbi:hypothetical protein C9426_24800 [Serratia sp. S1B]|nr:hypothetical protein C9426_24800 [Serratia sp. S1B]